MELHFIIAMLGLFGGFVSGILGIGGGIIMAPMILYVPPFFGLPVLPMQTVAGLTIVQSLVACISGALSHHKFRCVSKELTLWMGTTIFLFALVGGVSTKFIPNSILLIIFALLALFAAIIMVLPVQKNDDLTDVPVLSFNRYKAILVAGSIGLLGGLVGQGGSFILIPLMIFFLGIPTRIALGSNLAIVFLSSLAAFLGKALTGQIVWSLTIPIILTVIPAAWIGGFVSQKVSAKGLRILLAIFIALAAIRIGLGIVFAEIP